MRIGNGIQAFKLWEAYHFNDHEWPLSYVSHVLTTRAASLGQLSFLLAIIVRQNQRALMSEPLPTNSESVLMIAAVAGVS